MTSPEITKLRVGIDQFHATGPDAEGDETFYMATRILPIQYGRAILQIDEMVERLLPGERHQITPQHVHALGWRCLRGDRVRGSFMDKDPWIQSVIARACGAVIATGTPFQSEDGVKRLPVRVLADITDEEGRLAPAYDSNGVKVPRPNSQLYVPVNADLLPDVARGQFVRQ